MKRLSIILSLVLALLVMVSCDRQFHYNDIAWEQTSALHQLDDNATIGLAYDINVEIPKNDYGGSINSFIRKQLLEIIFSSTPMGDNVELDYENIDKTVANFISASNESLNRMSERDTFDDGYGMWTWEITLDGRCISANDTFITYQLDHNYYTGGPHGTYGTKYYTFETQTGRMVHDAEFWKTGTEQQVDRLLMHSLLNHMNSCEEEMDITIFNTDGLHSHDNFRITRDSIFYTFNIYEIAPYAYGGFTLGLSAEEASPYLKESALPFTFWKSK